MRYKQYDYAPSAAAATDDAVRALWTSHWDGRVGWDPDHKNEALWPTIADIITRPGLLLEAGCGTGKWVDYFGNLGHRAIGVDYAPTALGVALRTKPTLSVLRADCRKMPFPSETFDYLFANGTVEHDVAGPEANLREFLRVLKPGGWLMSSVPCLNTERHLMLWWLVGRDWLKRRETLRRLAGKTDPFLFYQYVLSRGEYRRILESCGFRVAHLRPYGEQRDGTPIEILRPLFRSHAPFYCPHMVMAICQRPL
jgi:SAM-dependent methyltransferase